MRVYDTSGPYSDPAVATDIRTGLPELRRPWILARGDVEEYRRPRRSGRRTTGCRRGEAGAVPQFDRAGRKVLRAKPGAGGDADRLCPRGIITPEMEYVAIRENLGREQRRARARATASPSAPRSRIT